MKWGALSRKRAMFCKDTCVHVMVLRTFGLQACQVLQVPLQHPDSELLESYVYSLPVARPPVQVDDAGQGRLLGVRDVVAELADPPQRLDRLPVVENGVLGMLLRTHSGKVKNANFIGFRLGDRLPYRLMTVLGAAVFLGLPIPPFV